MTRNIIRNRKTGQESSQYVNTSVVPKSMFNKPISSVDEYTSFLKSFDAYIELVKAQNPDLPRDKDGNTMYDLARKDILKNLNTFADVKNAGKIMYELSVLQNKGSALTSADEMKVITLSNRLNQIIARQSTKAQDDSYSINNFFKILGTNLATAAMDNVLPGSSLVLPLFLTWVTTSNAQESSNSADNWRQNNGRPVGGTNMCSSFSGPENYCKQGYLTRGDQPWTPQDPQYSFGAQPSGSALGDAGAAITLQKCISADKVGVVVQEIMSSVGNTTDPLIKCGTTLSKWHDFQSTVTATLPASQCSAFSAAGSSVAQSCQKNSSVLKWDWLIGGSIVGGFIALACICGGAYYCIASGACDDVKCNPC